MFDRLMGELRKALPDPFVTTDSLVGTVAALHRFESAVSAHKHAFIAELFTRFEEIAALNDEYSTIDPWDALEAELGPALTITPHHASSLMSLGVSLARRLPNVWDAFSRGELDLARVRIIADATSNVADEYVKEIEQRALKAALDGRAPLSGARLRNAVNRAIAHVDADGLRRRRERAKAERNVWIGNGSDGMAELGGSLLAEDAVFLTNRLGEMAKRVCTDDPRSFQARRADALIALTHGKADLDCQCGILECPYKAGAGGTPRRPLVHVVASAATLDGTSDEPAWIDGYGLIDAEHLREIAKDAIVRALEEPTEEDRYRPSQALSDWVRALHGTCQFPGCDRAAWESDVDHAAPHGKGGATKPWNLGPYCRKHHRGKTFGGWQMRHTMTLISPLGFEYPIPPTGPLALLLEHDSPEPKRQPRMGGRAERAAHERTLNKADREQRYGPDDDPPLF